jgi:hypothetical protein
LTPAASASAREPHHIAAVPCGFARIDPTRDVELIFGQRDDSALLLRDETVEIGFLLRTDDVIGFGISDENRHLEAGKRAHQGLVLGRFRGLVEQQIDADGAGALLGQRGQQVAQELTIDWGAIGKLRQRVLGDCNDDNIGILRFFRRECRNLPIGYELVGVGEKRQIVDRGGCEKRGQRRYGDGNQGKLGGGPFLELRDPGEDACDHCLFRNRASAWASQPFPASHAARIGSLDKIGGTFSTLTADWAPLSVTR